MGAASLLSVSLWGACAATQAPKASTHPNVVVEIVMRAPVNRLTETTVTLGEVPLRTFHPPEPRTSFEATLPGGQAVIRFDTSLGDFDSKVGTESVFAQRPTGAGVEIAGKRSQYEMMKKSRQCGDLAVFRVEPGQAYRVVHVVEDDQTCSTTCFRDTEAFGC